MGGISHNGRLLGTTGIATSMLLLFICGCSTAPRPKAANQITPQSTPPAIAGDRVISPGDWLLIVFGDLPEPRTNIQVVVSVATNGMIELPEAQMISTAGKGFVELEDAIKSRYVPGLYRSMAVRVYLTTPMPFSVTGEVKNPRPLHFRSVSVLEAIKLAGGFNRHANPKKVQFKRINGEVMVVNCDKNAVDPGRDQKVSPGDVIFVPRAE